MESLVGPFIAALGISLAAGIGEGDAQILWDRHGERIKKALRSQGLAENFACQAIVEEMMVSPVKEGDAQILWDRHGERIQKALAKDPSGELAVHIACTAIIAEMTVLSAKRRARKPSPLNLESSER